MAFYSPSDVPKRFTSEVKKCPPSGRWVASEIVQFFQEFRAYILHGKVVLCAPYLGTEDAAPAFPWAAEVPKGLCAAIDYGYVADGRLLPIEVGDPYSCGWYGNLSEHAIFTAFLLDGWAWMKQNNAV